MTPSAILAQPGQRRHIPVAVFMRDSPPASEPVKARSRILLVEDDFIVAYEMEYWLSDAGFEVVGPAATAEDAVRLAFETKPELAIMDIRLAGPRDGIDAAIEIYRDYGVRSIFATAHSDARTIERGKAAHPLDWMPKPYSPATLIGKIKAALKRKAD